MKKQMLMLCILVFAVSTYGCKDRADKQLDETNVRNRIAKIEQEENQRKENLKYKMIAEFVESSKTRKEKVSYNITVNDIGMTKGRAIKVFGIPDSISMDHRNGFWGTHKSTLWEYPGGLRLQFKNDLLTTWQQKGI